MSSKFKLYEAKKKTDSTSDTSYQTSSTYKCRIPKYRSDSSKQIFPKSKNIEEIHVPMGSRKEDMHKSYHNCDDQKHLQTVTQMKLNWQNTVTKLEKLKKELDDKQSQYAKTHSTLCSMHAKLQSHGHHVELPPGAPEPPALHDGTALTEEKEFSRDLKKLLNIPTQLLNTCESALEKRNQIVKWLESLSEDKGLRNKNFNKRIQEFKSEGESLQKSLEGCKVLCFDEFKEITEFLRNSIAETNTLQSQTKNLEAQLAELSNENVLLSKQIQSIDGIKTSELVEKLDKELQSERSRVEALGASLRAATERAAEAVKDAADLQQALDDNRSMTAQMLEKQAIAMQDEFNLLKAALEETLKQKQNYVDELTKNQEFLNEAKKDLESRLEILSKSFSEEKRNRKQTSCKLAKLEEEYSNEIENKKELENKIELLLARLADRELECKEIKDQLKSEEFSMCKELNDEIEHYKKQLVNADEEITKLEMEIINSKETTKSIEANYHTLMTEKNLIMEELKTKEQSIVDLERKQNFLQQKLLDSENKMASYESQITSLKDHVDEIKKEFGDLKNLSELNNMVNQQHANLDELRKQNEDLTAKLQKQDLDLQTHQKNVTEQILLVQKKDDIIKSLKQNVDQQTSAIELLKMKLEKKSQLDPEVVGQLRSKDTEIQTLHKRLSIEKQKRDQLEKMILTLEEGARMERTKCLSPNKTYYQPCDPPGASAGMTPDKLDTLIRILENELDCPMPPSVCHKYNEPDRLNKKYNTPQQPDVRCVFADHPDEKRKLLYSCNVPKKTYTPKFSAQARDPHVRHSRDEERDFEGMRDMNTNINPRKYSHVSPHRDEKRTRIRQTAGHSRINAML